MISWTDYDARLAEHKERIARVERADRLAVSPELGRRRRGMVATTVAILAWTSSRAGAALIVLGRWLSADERVAEVG